MITSILALLCAIIPFGIFQWKRRIQNQSDPATQNQNRHEAIAKEILVRDPERINRDLASDLDRLRSLSGNKQRSSGGSTEGK